MESETNTKLVNPFAMKSISMLYLKSDFADVHFTFFIGNQTEKVPAHKAILASASPVFAAMFFGPLKEADIVRITDSNANAFKEFLQLVYLPEITLTMDNHEEVLRLADKYGMIDCIETFIPFIERHLAIENMSMGYQLAISFNSSELKNFCERRIRGLTKDVLKSQSFLQCTRKVIEQILQQNVLECNEIDLFEACIEWAKLECQRNRKDENNPENLKKQLGDCFYLIRFLAMDDLEMSKILSNPVYKKLFTQEESMDIMQKKFDKNFQSNIFNAIPRSKVMNDSTKLKCKPKQYKKGSVYFIKKKESTWLSTNEPILLTSINFCGLQSDLGYGQGYDLSASMEIIEYNSSTIATNAPSKVVNKLQRSYIDKSMFGVPTPSIIMNPKKIYEIRWIFPDSQTKYRPYHSYECPSTDVTVNDKITITFHRNPLDTENDRLGLVSELMFYPL